MNSTEAGLSQGDLEVALRTIGVLPGMLLEVHSSLSSLGHVAGGAKSVVYALMTSVGPSGGIVMPTFPVSAPLPLSDTDRERGVIFKIRKFDETSDARSGMGVIPDTFRKMPGVITGKGEHRVSAWGGDAEKNAEGLSNLIESGGYALLIGVDIYRLTSMHYMEGKLPERVQMTYEASEDVLRYYPKDQWYVQTGSPPAQAWYKIQDEAYRRGLIRESLIGKSRCMFFRVNDVVRIYEKAIESDPFGLFGLTQ